MTRFAVFLIFLLKMRKHLFVLKTIALKWKRLDGSRKK
jgi:hypothetical protein